MPSLICSATSTSIVFARHQVLMQLDPNKEAQLQLLPQDRVLNVKPCWATTSTEGRVELLSISLEELRLRAIDLAEKARKQAGPFCQHAVQA